MTRPRPDPSSDLMSDPRPDPARAPEPGLRQMPVVLGIAVICIAIELALQAADQGLIGSPLWRRLAYQYGAFWPGLLDNWKPNYPAQPVTMFFSYAFLHGGLGHLVGNVITLVSLAGIAVARVGQRGFLAIYAASAGVGALTYAALLPGPYPMVGASGALFGLAGAWQYWVQADAPRRRRAWITLRAALGLIGLNLLLLWYLDGRMAWQTHLGGFVAGWVTAGVLHRSKS